MLSCEILFHLQSTTENFVTEQSAKDVEVREFLKLTSDHLRLNFSVYILELRNRTIQYAILRDTFYSKWETLLLNSFQLMNLTDRRFAYSSFLCRKFLVDPQILIALSCLRQFISEVVSLPNYNNFTLESRSSVFIFRVFSSPDPRLFRRGLLVSKGSWGEWKMRARGERW